MQKVLANIRFRKENLNEIVEINFCTRNVSATLSVAGRILQVAFYSSADYGSVSFVCYTRQSV